jgi:hypothetical protein
MMVMARVLAGLATVALVGGLGAILLPGCGDPCQAPLSSYCSGSDCPTWDQAVADAKEFAAGSCNVDWSASSGRCAGYLYVLKVIGIGSSITQYFDASGVLVAVRSQSDTPNSCDDSSFEFWYGPTLDCELELVDDFCYPVDALSSHQPLARRWRSPK